ncbi:MAG TPA: extracellular solute-binding protein [Aggregatilineales bacterium]|nr:extracellular solute-binding protein [Aggregatilineales bacterium]
MSDEKMLLLLVSAWAKGTLVILAAFICLALLRRASASIRSWLCSLAVISALGIPLLTLAIPTWTLPVLPARFQVSNNSVASEKGMDKLFSSGAAPLPGAPPSSPGNLSRSAAASSRTTALTANASQTNPLPAGSRLPAGPTTPSAFQVAIVIWFVGALLVMGRWIIQGARVWWIMRWELVIVDPAWTELCAGLATQMNIHRKIRLILSDKMDPPFTWGLWHPSILLPADALNWDPAKRRIVLLHELAHIARWDYLTQWLALLCAAANWFNPLVWKLLRHLNIERERACDDLVLVFGTRSTDYATSLLEISRATRTKPAIRAAVPGVLALEQPSNLGARIRRILDSAQNRRPMSRRRSLSLILALALVLPPLSTVQLSPIAAQETSIVLSIALPGGGDDQSSQSLFSEFEAAHPGVTVKVVDADSYPLSDAADGLDMYFTALQKYASAADVLAFQGFNLSLTPFATRGGYVLDMAPLITSDSSFQSRDFYPPMLAAYQWDHGTWALPIGAVPVLLSYDKSAFDRAGIAYPDGHWTLDDFVSVVKKLTLKDATGHVTAAGFANSGRIFREALWRSLIGADVTDDNSAQAMPHFDTPVAEAVMDAYFQLEQQGDISGDTNSAAMFVGDVRSQDFNQPGRGWSLLPGNKAALLPDGLAISAGTQHADLSYALIKFLTTRPEFKSLLPTLKSQAQVSMISSPTLAPEIKDMLNSAVSDGLSYSNLRFMDYLNATWISHPTSAKAGLQTEEARAVSDLKTADGKKATQALVINEPAPPAVAPGKVVLKFDVTSYIKPLPTQDQWNRVIQDFTSTDPQVGAVELRAGYETAQDAASRADCFYEPNNAVSTAGDAVLNLDPFLNADRGFDKSDFVGNILLAVQRNNKTYALPIDIEPLILRYSSQQFRQANLPMPTNTWTVESFADSLRALKAAGDGEAPFVDSATNGTYLMVLIAAYGGVPIDYRTTPPTINFSDAAKVTAIRQVLDLAKAGYLRYAALSNLSDPSNLLPGPTTPLYPSYLTGFTGKKPIPGASIDKPVLFPAGRQSSALAYDLGTAYISAQSQNPQACYRFISMIAAHPELFSTMPVRRSILTSQTLQSTTTPEVMALYNQIAAILSDPHTVPIPMFDKGSVTVSNILLEHWLYEAFDSYVLHGGDLDAGLKTAETYAKGFEDCTANLSPLMVNSAGQSTHDLTRAYLDCAENADSRLKPILEALVNNS